MKLLACQNFVECLSQLSTTQKSYISKHEDGFKILTHKKGKTLNTAAIAEISAQCFEGIKAAALNSNDKKTLLQTFGKALETLSQKVAASKPWWKKIAIFICKLFCKSTANNQIDIKIGAFAKKVLAHESSIPHDPFDLSLKSIRKTVLDNPKVAKLFELTKDIGSTDLRTYLDAMGQDERTGLVKLLKQNYSQFLKWMKLAGALEEGTEDPVCKKERMRAKSQFAADVYGKYSKIVYAITANYDKLLDNKLWANPDLHLPSATDPTRFVEPYPCTALMPDGMRLMIERHKKTKAVPDVVICNGYQDFEKALADLTAKPDGQYYYLVRAKYSGPTYYTVDEQVHQTPVLIEKKLNQCTAFVIDSADALGKYTTHYIDEIGDLILQALPKTEMYITSVARQYDRFNCGVLALGTIKDLFKAKIRGPEVISF